MSKKIFGPTVANTAAQTASMVNVKSIGRSKVYFLCKGFLQDLHLIPQHYSLSFQKLESVHLKAYLHHFTGQIQVWWSRWVCTYIYLNLIPNTGLRYCCSRTLWDAPLPEVEHTACTTLPNVSLKLWALQKGREYSLEQLCVWAILKFLT